MNLRVCLKWIWMEWEVLAWKVGRVWGSNESAKFFLLPENQTGTGR